MDFDADDSDKLPELPPMGHPLQKLGARLAELLDDDHWAECERLLLEGWAHDEIDRKTGVFVMGLAPERTSTRSRPDGASQQQAAGETSPFSFVGQL